MNNKYIIRAKHPLLRPGLSIETEASEKYVVSVLLTLLNLIREFNKTAEETEHWKECLEIQKRVISYEEEKEHKEKGS